LVNSGKEPAPGFLIEWYKQKVDDAIQKHGTGKREGWLARLPEHYSNPRHLSDDWIRRYLAREKDELAVDAVLAFDEVDNLRKKLDRANLKLRCLTAGLCGTWAVLPFFLKWLIPYAIKGMLK
jgi:hypothetical protein